MRGPQTVVAGEANHHVNPESSSNSKAPQHTEVFHESGATMKECCDEQNDLKSESCAITVTRDELNKMKGRACSLRCSKTTNYNLRWIS